ncbi:MAG: HupE/UreJ family protein, partial [Deltaproteobacteria bacterium]|nr:HupE/UreJ family protein [Deltaproteobacteria bacterium]
MALNNLRPFVPARWSVIFVFGLFHGLGFATVMGHLTFRMVDLVKVMVLFNVG